MQYRSTNEYLYKTLPLTLLCRYIWQYAIVHNVYKYYSYYKYYESWRVRVQIQITILASIKLETCKEYKTCWDSFHWNSRYTFPSLLSLIKLYNIYVIRLVERYCDYKCAVSRNTYLITHKVLYYKLCMYTYFMSCLHYTHL